MWRRFDAIMTLLLRHVTIGMSVITMYIGTSTLIMYKERDVLGLFIMLLVLSIVLVFRIFYFVMTRINVIYQWQIWQTFFDWNFVTLVRFCGSKQMIGKLTNVTNPTMRPSDILHHSKQKCALALVGYCIVRFVTLVYYYHFQVNTRAESLMMMMMWRTAKLAVIRGDWVWGSNLWLSHDLWMLSAILVLCEGNPPVTSVFSNKRPVIMGVDAKLDKPLIGTVELPFWDALH